MEPSECVLVLEELENWASILKSEPEVIDRLAAFEKAAEGSAEAADDEQNIVPVSEPAP